jgi:hypothetical protein
MTLRAQGGVREIARQRLHRQRLAGPRTSSPEEVVRWLGAVQSQDFAGAKWGIAQRSTAVTDAVLDRLYDEGRLVRTHAMRPTWHFVHREDLRWLLALTGERVKAANASRDRQLEIDGGVMRRSRALMVAALRDHEYRTRRELGGMLAEAGIRTDENRLAHILMNAELDAVICSGPLRAGRITYALVDERVPAAAPRSRDEALAELTLRYFRSHGPATLHDYAWWSGLLVSEARRGIESVRAELESLTDEGGQYWSGSEVGAGRPRGTVHLLPNFDEHVVAYRDHGPSHDPSIAWERDVTTERLAPHIVIADGLAIGSWRRLRHASGTTVELHLRKDASPTIERALARAAADYSRYLATPVALTKAPSRRRA